LVNTERLELPKRPIHSNGLQMYEIYLIENKTKQKLEGLYRSFKLGILKDSP
jgi:hypothetical protein